MLLFWVPNPIIGLAQNLARWASFYKIWGPITVPPWALEDAMGCSSSPLSVSLIKLFLFTNKTKQNKISFKSSIKK